MINLTLIVIFAAILIIIGLRYGGAATPDNYHMANHRVSWIRVAFSSFSVAGGGEIVTLVAFTYFFGFWGIALFAGFSLGFWGLAYFAPKFRGMTDGLKIYSVPDFLRSKYGSLVGLLAFLYSSLSVGALLLIQLIVGGLLISTLTGIPTWVGSGLVATTVAIYVVIGGFKSVLITDVIQSVAMFLAISLLLIFGLKTTPDFMSKITELTVQGIPKGDLITLLVSGFFAVFGAADIWQRMLSAKTNSDASRGLIAAGVAFLIFGSLVIFFGVFVASSMPQVDPNNAFIELLQTQLGGIFGMVLTILVTASVFSTADTELFVLATMTSREIAERDLEKDIVTKQSRLLVVILLAVIFLISLVAHQLVDIYFFLVLFFMILGPTVLSALFNRGSPITVAISLALSGLILSYLIITGTTTGYWPLVSLIPGLLPLLQPAKQR